MTQDYVVTVTSIDRVGIIAAVSKAVAELDGNIDALSQTVMNGYFTLILTTHFDDDIEPLTLKEAVQAGGKRSELGVLVRERKLMGACTSTQDCEKFILTITGKDRKGVVERVSGYLAGRNVNIEDLYARSENGEFLMVAELQVPAECNVENMQLDLGGLWCDEDVKVSLQHENIFLAINQLDF